MSIFARVTWMAVACATVAAVVALAAPSRDGSSGSAPHGRIAAVRHPFFRAVYGGYGGTRLTPAREGARYGLMILHDYDRRVLPRLRARNPGLKVLMYVDMASSDPRDPSGRMDWAGYADATARHPGWFLRGRRGRPLIFKDYPTSRLMDVGNRSYQDAGAARVIRTATAAGFDGVFLDDANASLRWVLAGGSAACVTYPTTPQWQSAVYSFLSNVGPQLRRAGLLAVANIGGSTITPGLWEQWNGPLDGAMEESFTNGGAGPDTLANGQWQGKLSHAVWSEEHGKIGLDHAVTSKRRGARYGLATMLLAAGGENLFSASTDYSHEVWWPDYAIAGALGSPLGRYRVLPNGVYRRDFANGVVLVNPGARATRVVRLGGTYSGSGLRRVTRVSLAPASGVVLAKAGS
ncbi:MAG TPA: putative glycoside hydrolase [Thermoleophilaceae bacterium]|jgi:hypothetical protein